MLVDLSRRQTVLLEYIRKFRTTKGYSPSVREMQDYMGIASQNGLMCHLKALKKKGYVEWNHCQARSVRLTDEAREKPGIPLLTLDVLSEHRMVR